MFGVLPFRPYDYIVVPHTTTYRLDFDAGVDADFLVIEASNNITMPPRYLNPDGQLRLGLAVPANAISMGPARP